MTVPTLILGEGTCALAAACELASQGCDIILATTKDSPDSLENQMHQFEVLNMASVEWLTGVRLHACNGFVGQFTADFEKNGKLLHRQVSSIIISEKSDRRTNFEVYGLQPGPTVRSLSSFSEELNTKASEFSQKQIVFLHGLNQESEPVVTAEIMHCAQTLQTLSGTRTHVLTRNLKVAGNGLETLYRETKSDGVFFFKFTDALPAIHQITNNEWEIDFRDEITGLRYRMTPDILVVDETIVPSAYLSSLADILRLDRDSDGFLQTENVHRLPVLTNRRGILAIGPSRAAMSVEDSITEAACGALAVIGLDSTGGHDGDGSAEINSGQCIRCLTCYRLCPYGSIKRGKRIEIIPNACAGCGICHAECPRTAIQLSSIDSTFDNHIRNDAVHLKQDIDPVIMAFCCGRSAAQAHDQAIRLRHQMPTNLKVVTVPCAGAISTAIILEAFSQGAAGVLVLTCHEGNCHSEAGNQHARRRVEYLAGHLDTIGVGGDRLAIATLAANMETEFVQITRDFTQILQEMKGMESYMELPDNQR